MAPPGSAGLTTCGAFFISLKVKGASMRPCFGSVMGMINDLEVKVFWPT
jgi:hypothetical protein